MDTLGIIGYTHKPKLTAEPLLMHADTGIPEPVTAAAPKCCKEHSLLSHDSGAFGGTLGPAAWNQKFACWPRSMADVSAQNKLKSIY